MFYAPECEPCIRRQVREALKLLEAGEKQAREITAATENLFSRREEFDDGLAFAAAIHHKIAEMAGTGDVYKEMKDASTRQALALFPKIKEAVEKQGDPLLAALKVAAAGNIVDAGAVGLDIPIAEVVQTAIDEPFGRDDSARLAGELAAAETILLIGDNAGETVFDRLLLEIIFQQLGAKKVHYAVKSAPIINDATAEDAEAAGLDKVAAIFDLGAALPGMVYSCTNQKFKQLFAEADVVISKGQGNFEGRAGLAQRPVYFLLRVKCEPNARALEVTPGTQVLVRLP